MKKLSLALLALIFGVLLVACAAPAAEEQPAVEEPVVEEPAMEEEMAEDEMMEEEMAEDEMMEEDMAEGEELSGEILIDGSSTVFPISEALAEEFMAANGGVRVNVGLSGTGGGFEAFCSGETAISNASRPIREDEIALCQENGIEYVEVPIAYDGISVVVNPSNDFVECLTIDQLNAIWSPEAEETVTNWNQVDPSYPDLPISLYGPGVDSGTFDYFTDEINGEEGASRGDYTASEDDNVLVQGVANDEGGLGYFGFAYYEANQDTLKLVSVDGGEGCVTPSAESIGDASYAPLSRPLFNYYSVEALDRPEVAAFVDFSLNNAATLAPEVGYPPLPAELYEAAMQRVENRTTGSVYEGGTVEGTVSELFLGQ